MKFSNVELFRQGLMACVPTLLGYSAVGFACGAIGTVSGFETYQIAFMTIFLYAGSAQFLFYSLALAGAGVFQLILAIAFINMRYLLVNTYMAQFFRDASITDKLLGGLLMTDETFGVAAQYAKKHDDTLPFSWLLGLNLTAWISWIISTMAGVLLASYLPSWLRDSLSFSLAGMFVGLLIMGFQESRTRIIDVIVILISMGVVVFTHGVLDESFISIVATLIAASVGTILLMTVSRAK